MSIPIEKIIALNELRIGNYLEYEGKIVHVTMLSMDIDDEYEEQICFCELGKTNNEKGGWNRALADKLNRIVLTPQILARCGFELKTHQMAGNVWVIPIMKSADRYLQIASMTPSTRLAFVKEPGNEVALNEIMYLHQLQNIHFAITSEELKLQP